MTPTPKNPRLSAKDAARRNQTDPRNVGLLILAAAGVLNPVVLLGAAGLTPAVLQEIDRALTAHELIKVRLAGMDRDARQAASEQISDSTSSAAVQLIGNVLVLYRPKPDEDDPA